VRALSGYPASQLSGKFRVLVALLVGIIGVICASCGRSGVPSPPVHLNERTTSLEAMQRGSAVVLWWPSPPLNAKSYSRQYVDRIDIYKLIEHRDQEPTIDPDEYEDKAELVREYDRDEIVRQARERGRIEFYDILDLTGDPGRISDMRLRYAIRYINKDGQEGRFSNSVSIEPVPAVANAPTGLRAKAVAQDKVALTWNPPVADVDGGPAKVVGYNVYRRMENEPNKASDRLVPFELLNKDPWIVPSFTDSKFKYLAEYEYMVRTLSAGTTGLIESEDSDPIAFTAVDTFKPSAPNSVSIASGNGVISLFWPASPEADVAGYNIYRADSKDAVAKDWTKLNPNLNSATTFQDSTARIGERYFYRVTAVDRFKNESDPSNIVDEVANP
jgi:hypothetical protein